MKYYESLYIVNPNYENDRLDEVMKMVTDKLGEYKFSIINHRSWGKKRLAYSIEKHKYGSFILLHFETESVGNLNRFERFMVLQKQILRNQKHCSIQRYPKILRFQNHIAHILTSQKLAISNNIVSLRSITVSL